MPLHCWKYDYVWIWFFSICIRILEDSRKVDITLLEIWLCIYVYHSDYYTLNSALFVYYNFNVRNTIMLILSQKSLWIGLKDRCLKYSKFLINNKLMNLTFPLFILFCLMCNIKVDIYLKKFILNNIKLRCTLQISGEWYIILKMYDKTKIFF